MTAHAPQSTATVPPMTLTVRAELFGGQYLEQRELHAVFTCVNGAVRIEAQDDIGAPRLTLELDPDAARAALDALHERSHVKEVAGVPGLERRLRWQLTEGSDSCDLSGDLEEIAAWLGYATGEEQWPQEEAVWEW